MADTPEHVDVLIVGAGLSGIGAGCHLRMSCPGKTFAILESRDAIGGTWDLFRYPGIRSDSDMFTLGYPFRPWPEAEAIADGPSIRSYVRDTAREYGLEDTIRFHQRVVAAEWSTEDARWTVDVERTDTHERLQLTCGFLFMCTGYYRYDEGFTPEFEGSERFGGEIVHPQHWPEELDYAGKRVVGDRKRCHGGDAGARHGRRGRPRDDAAALAELRGLAARHRSARRLCSAACCPRRPLFGSCAGRTCCYPRRSSMLAVAGRS